MSECLRNPRAVEGVSAKSTAERSAEAVQVSESGLIRPGLILFENQQSFNALENFGVCLHYMKMKFPWKSAEAVAGQC